MESPGYQVLRRVQTLVAEFISPKKVYTFSFIVGDIIQKVKKCIHSATKKHKHQDWGTQAVRSEGLELGFSGSGFRVWGL